MVRIILFFCVFFSACSKNEIPIPKQTARISIQSEPASLDPRKSRDLDSGVLLRMVFEGLMRVSKDGHLESALANSIDISEDHLTYVFHLKKTYWSDGSPLTASDFLYSWKTILDPSFPTDIAYHLYPIKNAKMAKIGVVSLDDIGIHVLEPYTLVVELEQPTPYFLELLTMPPFFPVPRHITENNSHWALEADSLVSNGPFLVDSWSHADFISLTKNRLYWQSDEVKLEAVDLFIAISDTGLKMFEEHKLDWMGSPLSTIPADAVAALKETKIFQSCPFLATSFCRVNVSGVFREKNNPLCSPLFRRSLAVSLDRFAIVEHLLRGGQTVATRLVPAELGLTRDGYFQDNSPLEGVKLLELAKEEINEPLEPITISYYNNERNALIAQALQKQWQDRLQIAVEIEAVEPKVYFQRISKKEYQIAIGSWTADFNDPINFLEVFKYKDNGTNNTGWENPEYIDLLNRSALCMNLEERKQILSRAEEILMKDLPIIPIYHFALNYVKADDLTGVILSPQGHLDLRWASFK